MGWGVTDGESLEARFFYGEDNDSMGGRQKAWEGKSDLDWEYEGERQHWIGLIFGLSNQAQDKELETETLCEKDKKI